MVKTLSFYTTLPTDNNEMGGLELYMVDIPESVITELQALYTDQETYNDKLQAILQEEAKQQRLKKKLNDKYYTPDNYYWKSSSVENSKKPVSEIIRHRLVESGKRYFANDNISEFIREGEKEALIDELQLKFESVLDSLLIDRENDPNSNDTGRRLAKMYVNELFEGRYSTVPNATAFPNTGKDAYRGMLVVRSELKSVCSHHHQPVTGIAYIGILPGEKVIGLSKYTRIAQHCARRGTLQEELCMDIANAIQQATESEDVAVYIQATHGCCENRGIMAHSSLTQTTVLRGEFKIADVKKEFFDNIKLQSNFKCE